MFGFYVVGSRLELWRCESKQSLETGLMPSVDCQVSSNHEAESRHDDDDDFYVQQALYTSSDGSMEPGLFPGAFKR